MSGFEVAGLVLGVLPIAVQALRGYMGLLSSIKQSERTLKALIRDLETEHLRLQTTCEVLLDGVAPPTAIDELIRTPLSPKWEPYNDQIRLRLWTTWDKFYEHILDMQKAAEELREKLCLERDGSTKLKDKTAILRELKQKTSFTLKREDYEYILSRIKDANSVLHDLTGQNCGLEPSRKHRSQTRLIKLIRGLTSSICNGLRRATTCSCAESHNVCLGLEHRNAVLVPSDSEEQVAKRFDFHLLMAREARIGQQADDDFSWESMQAKLTDNIAPRPLSISTNTSPPALPSNPSRVSRGVRWSRTLSTMLNKETSASPDTQFGTVSATQTLVQSSRALVIQGSVSSTAYTPGNLSDICRVVLKKGGKNRAMGCYGYITDQERKFELRPLPDLSEGRSTITLRELLSSRQNTGLPPFGYPDKLRVAEALSISILHLYSTPWLPKIVTLDDILFIRGGGTQSPDTEYSYRPFLTRSLQNEQRCSNPSTLTLSRPVNLTVLSLGALLIQVIIGRVVDDLDMSKAVITMDSILSKHEVGTKFSDEIITNGGINYAAAVRWCLGTVLEVSGLESDEFCQKFYGAVVAKLEEDIRTSSWGTA